MLAAVYGPLETTAAKESAEHANVEVVFKPRAGLTGAAGSSYQPHQLPPTSFGYAPGTLQCSSCCERGDALARTARSQQSERTPSRLLQGALRSTWRA